MYASAYFWTYKSLEEPNSYLVDAYMHLKLPICLPKGLNQFINMPEPYENMLPHTHANTARNSTF